MEFNGLDVDSMFAAAAGAAEDSGEKEMDNYGKNPKDNKSTKTTTAVAEPPKVEKKVEPVKVEPVKQPERKPEPVPAPTPVREVVKETARDPEPKPLLNERPSGIINTSKGITEDAIGKILEMNQIYTKFDDTQKEFVSGYFKLDEGDNGVEKVIYKALIASQRDLDALSKIVDAKGFDPAGRAFFLMELDNSIIEDVFEQVELLTGELGKSSRVTDSNKLTICRKIEGIISEMDKDVFTYIEKLQTFTNKAVK